MAVYLHDVEEEKFNELFEDKIEDDRDVLDFLTQCYERKDDRRFNFTLLNLGTVMKICAIELELKGKEIEDYLKLDKDRTRDRKMAFILKELNRKINLRYDFDEGTEIVTCLYTYEGNGYIYVDKSTFCKLLFEKDIDIETLENV
ncbi:MAG: hypothetical protein J6B87_07520 [Clostridia bacterium]|nr:hypothetical protein [Clostridia bacterium]